MITGSITDLFTIYGDISALYGAPTRTQDGAYTFENGEISLKSAFNRHSSGVVERADTIKNISGRAITISCALSKFTLNGGEYEVFSQYNEHICECLGTWQPLVTGVYGMSDEIRTNQDVNPFVAVYNLQNGHGTAFHIMAESMFEYRVRRENEFLSPKLVTVELGIKSENFSYVLAPNEELALPKILFYDFTSKLDLDAYKLHRYCAEKYPKAQVPIIYNSWMSHFDDMSLESLTLQLERAAELGCEYFTVDAGWFGETQKWWDVVGDWSEPSDSGMCGKLKELSDRVRAKGLKFGLWFEIERSSKLSSNIKNHPELYISPPGQHAYVDFANPAACEHIYAILKENIDRYGVEFIKFDLNAPLCFDASRHAFIDYYKGYREFLLKIKADYPALHLECCASGGGRMSLSNVPYFDSFWMSDNHGIYEQLEIFKSALVRMPSSILERWATVRSLEGFTPTYPVGYTTEKILLSADSSWIRVEEANIEYIRNALVGGPIGVSCDLCQVSEATRAALAELIEKYKSERDFWHGSECRILCSTPSLTVLQFNDREFNTIKIFAYTQLSHQERVCVYPVIEGAGEFDVTMSERGGVISLERVCMSSSEIAEDGIDMCAWGLRNAYWLELRRK